jgi:tetratricopeptide (TPR) repeat protein
MRLVLALALPILALPILAAAPARAAEPPAPPAERVLGRLSPSYSQTSAFVPALLRFPLTRDPQAAYEAARLAAADAPTDLDAQRAAALAAEAAEKDGDAAEYWRVALGLAEARLRAAKDKKDPALLELQLEALIGADVAVRGVPVGAALLALRPGDWRAHLLAGDAHVRRADFNWRVLVRKAQGSPDLPSQPLLQLNSDLDAAQQAFQRAIELAPAEGAPRGAAIALALARPLMASLLPRGAVRAEPQPDLKTVRAMLVDWVRRAPGRTAPAWFAGLFFATQTTDPFTPEERSTLDAALAAARPEREAVFAHEARGLLAFARQEWAAARTEFAAALALEPKRAFCAEWLTVAEANSPEPRATVLERVRLRTEGGGTAPDWALLGMLIGEEDRSRAQAALRKAILLDVDNPNARYNLALLLLNQNPASVEARHHLRRTLEVRPDDREARFAYAATLLLDGLYKEARATLDSLMKLHDLDPRLKARLTAMREDIPAPPLPNQVGASPPQ